MDIIQQVTVAQLDVEQRFINKGKPLPQEYTHAVHGLIENLTDLENTYIKAAEDMSLAPLPHPERNLIAGLVPLPLMFKELGLKGSADMTEAVIDELLRPNLRLGEVAARLISHYEPIRRMVAESATTGQGVSNAGALMNILVPHCWVANNKPIFQIEQGLAEGLTLTSFASNTPTHYVRSPLRFCYIEFGDKRNLGVHVHNADSGLHEIEGCYVSESKPDSNRSSTALLDYLVERGIVERDSPTLRFMDIQFTGSPLGRNNNMDDATQDVSIYLDDESCDNLGEVIDCHMGYYRNLSAANTDDFQYKDMDSEQEKALRDGIELLVKSLVFINSDLTTRREILNRPPLLRSLKELTNPKKRRRAQQQLKKTRDYILVQPRDALSYSGGSGEGKSVSTHWRRGHIRNQRYGPKREKTKINWIQPTLVGAGSGTVKKYIVKE